ncbi:MAG TPA: LysR family transcriptional regulator [Inquilinus sp.]|nr:LysR family transcriptional regulator [Inquilinus sp.]
MEMHQIRYFLAVCDQLNFTRAAEVCHVAQPSLTRAIKLLEEELGGPLFHRERANTHLSELGRMLLPYLQQVYDQTQAAKKTALELTTGKRLQLRLGIMCTIAPAIVLDLIETVRKRYPALELMMVDASARALEEQLLAGELEAAIYCIPGERANERLHYIDLFREFFMIAIPAGHDLADRSEIRVRDLDGESYVNRRNCEIYECASAVFAAQNVRCPMIYSSERDDWVLAMIAAGLGFGFIPKYSITHPGVVARACVEPEFWRDVSLVTVRGRPHSPALGMLVRESMRMQWLGKEPLALQAAGQS